MYLHSRQSRTTRISMGAWRTLKIRDSCDERGHRGNVVIKEAAKERSPTCVLFTDVQFTISMCCETWGPLCLSMGALCLLVQIWLWFSSPLHFSAVFCSPTSYCVVTLWTVGVLRPISAKYFIKCAISYKAGDGKGKKNEDTSFIFQVELIKNSSSLQKENVWTSTTSWGFQVKSLQFICTTPCAVGMKCWALENLLQQSWKQWNMLKRPWTGSYCNFNQFFELQRVSMSCEETHSPPSWRWKWGIELLWVK